MFWLSKGAKSGTGFAARHQGDSHIATAQLATTGLCSLTYLHKVSEKVRSQQVCTAFQIYMLDAASRPGIRATVTSPPHSSRPQGSAR